MNSNSMLLGKGDQEKNVTIGLMVNVVRHTLFIYYHYNFEL